MKKIISIGLLIFSFLSFSDLASDKRIQVRGTATKEVSPNTAKLQLTIRTENENLDKASRQNSEIMEKYKNLLKKSNVKYEKINSTDYSTYKNYTYENVIVNKGKKEYSTTLNVDVSTLNLNQLQTFISVLAKENIFSTTRNKDMSYSFKIVSQKATSKEAYQDALNKLNSLKQKLSQKGFNGENLKISGFDNQEVNLEKYENKKVEENIVSHSFEVVTRDLRNLGKLVDLANVLGIETTGYIEYDIDNKDVLEDELYKTAYEEALKKAGTILDKTELKLRKPVTITDNSYGVISPYYSYFNKQYSDFNEEVLKKSDSALIEEAGNDSTIINPQKSSFSKTVYIEFEMN